MKKKDVLNEWLVVNTALHNALVELESLDTAREQLVKTMAESKEVSKAQLTEMKSYVEKYKKLLDTMMDLQRKAAVLKMKVREVKENS